MVWVPANPANDELLTNFPAQCRANWDALELLTDASLLVTNAKVAAAAGIVDTKLAQIVTAAKVSGAALTLLTNVPAGAGVLPSANSPNKLKADGSDTTPQYLDALLDTGVFQISAGDLLQLKDGGVETEKFESGAASPGNSKYYGTNSGGTKGFFVLPSGVTDHGALSGLGDDDHSQYLNVARHDADDHSGLSVAASMFPNYAIGNTLLISSDTEHGGGTSWTKVKEIKLYRAGSLRIKFLLKVSANSHHNQTAYGRIYRNGVAVGTEKSKYCNCPGDSGCGNSETFSEDISSWSVGDMCQIYVYHTDGEGGGSASNFRLYISPGSQIKEAVIQ